jgi:preprotein translocase subunit SecD
LLAFILIIFVLAATIVFPLDNGVLSGKGVTLGLDLKGGIHIVYLADLSGIPQEERSAAMDADVAAIRSRVDIFGVTEPVIQRQGDDRILVELPGISDVDRAKAVIGQTAILEFGERVLDENDPDIKWTNELGNWKPATAYFKQNTYITTDDFGRIILAFEWDDVGNQLSGQITQRLIGEPLGIFSGNEALKGDDGLPIAPIINSQITDRGIIEGLSQTEATQLSSCLMPDGSRYL